MSKVLSIISDAAQRADKTLDQTIPNNETLKDFCFRAFNFIYKNFNVRHTWPWREKTVVIQTVPNYETGTVEVMNGSRTVTGTMTGWTSAMAGRFLKLTRDHEMYEILSVDSSTSITLKVPYLDDSGSGLSYLIWKKFYDLPPEVPTGKGLNLRRYPQSPSAIPYKHFNTMFDSAYLQGFPEAWSQYGENRKTETYSTGTIATTKDSRTLTGTGTAWLDNVQDGAKIKIGSDVYNVDSVDSDTQITMVQHAIRDTSIQPYTIEAANRTQMVLSSVPIDPVNLYLTYPRRVYSLVNDNDEPQIWEEHEIALTNILYAYLLEKLSSQKSLSWLTVSEAQVKEVLKNIEENSPIDHAITMKRNVREGYRRTIYG